MTETLLTHVTFCPKRIAQRSTPMLHIPALSPKPPHTSKEVQRIQAGLVRSKEVYRRSLEKTIYKDHKKRPPVVSHHLLERSCWHLHLYIVNHLKLKKTKKLGVRLLWPKAPKIPKHAAKQLPNCPKSDMKSARFNLLAYTGIHVHYCIHKYVYVYASILYMSKSHMSIIYMSISRMSILCRYIHTYIWCQTLKSIYLSSSYLFQWFESILDLVSWVKTGGCSLPTWEDDHSKGSCKLT